MKEVCSHCGCVPAKPITGTAHEDVLREFVECYSLVECKERLQDLLTASFASHEADVWDGMKRSNMIFFCHNVAKVLEVMFERE